MLLISQGLCFIRFAGVNAQGKDCDTSNLKVIKCEHLE